MAKLIKQITVASLLFFIIAGCGYEKYNEEQIMTIRYNSYLLGQLSILQAINETKDLTNRDKKAIYYNLDIQRVKDSINIFYEQR